MKLSTKGRLRLAFLITCTTLFLGCGRVPSLTALNLEDESANSPFSGVASVSAIVIGRVLGSVAVGRPHPAKWDRYFTIQLFRATVGVENILRGDEMGSEIAVYYFSQVGSMGGPPRLGMFGQGGTWRTGDREVFFLRHDSGVLRTICDFSRSCVVPLRTGPHPGFQLDRFRPDADVIASLFLTRGTGCGDREMVRSISDNDGWSFSPGYAVQKLQKIALEEAPAVRSQACETLKMLGHPCAGR